MRTLATKKRLAVGISAALLLATVGCTTATTAEDTSAAGGDSDATEAVAPSGETGWCSGVKIAAFPGGPQGGVFANNVYNGFQQAEADLGADVTYYFSDWDAAKLVSQGKEALSTDIDGIATYGFGGEDAMGQLADEAFEKGIIFTTLNTELPDTFASYKAEGSGFVGAINYNAGYDLAAKTVQEAGLVSGDEVLVWGLVSLPGRGDRTQGVIDAFEEAGDGVQFDGIGVLVEVVLAGYRAEDLRGTLMPHLDDGFECAGEFQIDGHDVLSRLTQEVVRGRRHPRLRRRPANRGTSARLGVPW